jgi:hypothetical protein
MRDDTITNADPLFRAAAVANVRGGLTFMLWDDYQRVLANEQPRIQLVAVDAGQGCVLPDETTIADGSYPLSVSASLLIAREKLADTNVRAYLWTLFSDASEASFQSTGFVNDANFFNSTRSALAKAFEEVEAELAAREPEPEATPDAEATPNVEDASDTESTPSVEATPDAETIPDAETTPESTAEATAAP